MPKLSKNFEEILSLVHEDFEEKNKVLEPSTIIIIIHAYYNYDRLCGLVVRVSCYRYRGPGFHPRRYQIFLVVGLERGPLSLVRSIEELLEFKK